MVDYLITNTQMQDIVSKMNEIIAIINALPEHVEPIPIEKPITRFSATPLTGDYPLEVQFTNESIVADTYLWDYGNGFFGTLKDPVHQYLITGTYSVKLSATNSAGTTDLIKLNYITVTIPEPVGVAPVADFEATPTSGESPLSVLFTNKSTGTEPLTYKWDMSDGAGNLPENNMKNPLWRFWEDSGTKYTIKLTVTNQWGTSTKIKENYITLGSVTPEPDPFPDPIGFGCGETYLGSPIGGRAGYTDIKTSGTYVVNTVEGLRTYLSAAKIGEIVYVPHGTVLDMSGQAAITIPAGVTLASCRGANGSPGALIKYKAAPGSGWERPLFNATGKDIRVTGIQLEGEMYPESYSGNESNYLIGIKAVGTTNLIVDNCEIRGFAYANILPRNTVNTKIQHNYIHHSQNNGEGYGISPSGGSVIIEGNIFDRNRHSVSGEAVAGETVIIRYNKELANGYTVNAIVFDAHSDSGNTNAKRYDVYNNTVENSSLTTAAHKAAFLNFNQPLTEGAYVYNNLVKTDWGSGNDQGFTRPVQMKGSHTSLHCTNNQWKGTVYASNAGFVMGE